MDQIQSVLVNQPCAWKRKDLLAQSDWIHRLDPEMAAELDFAVRSSQSAGTTATTVDVNNFPLGPKFRAALQVISNQLEHGVGIALLRGVDVARYSRPQLDLLYMGIGAHLGTAVPQSKDGELIGLVVDTGKRLGEARGTKTRDPLPFHTDRCDVTGLFCLHKAKQGGESYVISAAAIHNDMLERQPDLASTLYEHYYHRRTDWEAATTEQVYALPVFSMSDGHFATRFLRHFIKTAQEIEATPRITEQQIKALDALELYFHDEEFLVSMPFEVGDIQFLNNFVAYHSRAGYEDHEADAERRLLLRLWLSMPNSRPLIDDFAALYGRTGAGQLRGGVPVSREQGNAP
jgi:hypothetical protein